MRKLEILNNKDGLIIPDSSNEHQIINFELENMVNRKMGELEDKIVKKIGTKIDSYEKEMRSIKEINSDILLELADIKQQNKNEAEENKQVNERINKQIERLNRDLETNLKHTRILNEKADNSDIEERLFELKTLYDKVKGDVGNLKDKSE